MNRLDRLESLAQELIEGFFNRFFKSSAAKRSEKEKTKTAEIPAAAVPSSASRWYLQLEERHIKLGELVIRIGRAMDNDVILNDPTVSRYHAQLRWRGNCYFLCPPDLYRNRAIKEQSSPTEPLATEQPRLTVNARSVIEQPLANGDVIKLGNAVLTILVESESPPGQD